MDIKLNNVRPTLAMAMLIVTKDSVWIEELFPQAPKNLAEIRSPAKIQCELTADGNDLTLTFTGNRPHCIIHKFLKFDREIEKIVLNDTSLCIYIENFPDLTFPVES